MRSISFVIPVGLAVTAIWMGAVHAAIYKATVLHPMGFRESIAEGVSAGSQIGWGATSNGLLAHALLWNGTTESVVDLHPPGYVDTFGRGVIGDRQVGVGQATPMSSSHALLWNGTAASFVDLHPDGYTSSVAIGIDGNTQVGAAGDHAALWNGTAASFVDLHPDGFTVSSAQAVSGSSQVGFAGPVLFIYHAILWQGTAASAIDLHPADFLNSEAYGVSGHRQVGRGVSALALQRHALLWEGTADSVIDLNPPGAILSEAHIEVDDQAQWDIQQLHVAEQLRLVDGMYVIGCSSATPHPFNRSQIRWEFTTEFSCRRLMAGYILDCGNSHPRGTVCCNSNRFQRRQFP
jgi:hypothetical protein